MAASGFFTHLIIPRDFSSITMMQDCHPNLKIPYPSNIADLGSYERNCSIFEMLVVTIFFPEILLKVKRCRWQPQRKMGQSFGTLVAQNEMSCASWGSQVLSSTSRYLQGRLMCYSFCLFKNYLQNSHLRVLNLLQYSDNLIVLCSFLVQNF